jgi:ABC-type phosphate/phosphonate transport system substrate-binding protein
MARNPRPLSALPVTKRPRGRPPKPEGRIPQVEVQRAYRARLAAAGKIVRLVDAAAVQPAPASAALIAITAFNPAPPPVYDNAMVEGLRNQLHNALLKLEIREGEQDVARLEARNAYLEGELKLQAQHHTNSLKEVIMLKQQLAAQKPAKRR